MVNQEVLTGKWNEVTGLLKEKWGNLTDDDLQAFNGNVDQLVGKIQRKTGESRAAIERFLAEVADDTSSIAGQVRDHVQAGASYAADTARQGYEALQDGYQEAERVVKRRPAQSVAVAFGLGFVAGAGIACLLRDRPAESRLAGRGRGMTNQIGRQLREAIASMMPER